MEALGFRFPFQIEGQPAVLEKDLPKITVRPISPDYFKTTGIALISGRDFNEQDRAGGNAVAIVNQTFVQAYFPQSDPVGKLLQSDSLKGKKISIVGVAADVMPEPSVASTSAVYLPFSQVPVPGSSLLVRTAGNPLIVMPAVHERIRALNPNVPLDKSHLLAQKVQGATTSPRFIMLMVGLFAALGMTLAGVGIYGVMSYAVNERTKEIGVRRALGAGEAQILWSVVRQGLTLTLLGLAAGLVAAFWTTSLIATLLF